MLLLTERQWSAFRAFETGKLDREGRYNGKTKRDEANTRNIELDRIVPRGENEIAMDDSGRRRNDITNRRYLCCTSRVKPIHDQWYLLRGKRA